MQILLKRFPIVDATRSLYLYFDFFDFPSMVDPLPCVCAPYTNNKAVARDGEYNYNDNLVAYNFWLNIILPGRWLSEGYTEWKNKASSCTNEHQKKSKEKKKERNKEKGKKKKIKSTAAQSEREKERKKPWACIHLGYIERQHIEKNESAIYIWYQRVISDVHPGLTCGAFERFTFGVRILTLIYLYILQNRYCILMLMLRRI